MVGKGRFRAAKRLKNIKNNINPHRIRTCNKTKTIRPSSETFIITLLKVAYGWKRDIQVFPNYPTTLNLYLDMSDKMQKTRKWLVHYGLRKHPKSEEIWPISKRTHQNDFLNLYCLYDTWMGICSNMHYILYLIQAS